MKKLNIFKTTVLAALAAAPFIAMTAQSALAQRVVAATCPQDYVLSGNRCVKTGPASSCPSGFGFSGDKCVASTPVASPAAKSTSGSQWAFITWKSFGVKTAAELDGATFCAPANSPSADAAGNFFKEKGLAVTHVKVDTDRAGIEKYQKYDCDILVVADRIARSTADSLKPEGEHLVLPEKFASLDTSPESAANPVTPVAPVVAPAPLPRKPPATVKKQPAPKKTVRKRRCSSIVYAYTRGNSCSCAGGRIFTGNACVRPMRSRWRYPAAPRR